MCVNDAYVFFLYKTQTISGRLLSKQTINFLFLNKIDSTNHLTMPTLAKYSSYRADSALNSGTKSKYNNTTTTENKGISMGSRNNKCENCSDDRTTCMRTKRKFSFLDSPFSYKNSFILQKNVTKNTTGDWILNLDSMRN